MKDITNDVFGSLTVDEIEKFRNYMFLGKRKKLPRKVFNQLLSVHKYYECGSINDLQNNYKKLTEKIRMPLLLTCFALSFGIKVVLSRNKWVSEHKKLREKYGSLHDRLLGERQDASDVFTLKVTKQNHVFMHDVRLKNFEHISNPLFSAYSFEVIDNNQHVIQGIYEYENFGQNIISSSENKLMEERTNIEMAKNAETGTRFAIYATALDPEFTDLEDDLKLKHRGFKLKVTHVQDAGKRPKIELPFVGLR